MTGVVVILTTYFMLQNDKLRYDDYSYLFLNIAGATLILVSLFNVFNLAAAAIEVAWIAISMFGAVKRWRRGRSESDI
jgi:paired small multidrug resistance pump